MERRVFLAMLTGGLVAAPRAAGAQQATRVWRIGLLDYASSDPSRLALWKAFQDRLRELGYVEGQNVVFEPRWGNGQVSRLQGLAVELVAAKVDVLVTASGTATRAAKRATSAIPIVTATGPDPVASGFAASLARPGGNVTGMTTISLELAPKRLELLKELLPKVSRVAVLADPDVEGGLQMSARDVEAARLLGIALQRVDARAEPKGLEAAFAAMRRDGVGAVIVVPNASFFSQRQRIAELALRHRLPSAHAPKAEAEAGGLISYGADFSDLFRRAAVYVDKILKGANPADLPIEQPTKFELVINLKTARALGLTVPQSLLVRADQVIQ